jgi:hypothetical protein
MRRRTSAVVALLALGAMAGLGLACGSAVEQGSNDVQSGLAPFVDECAVPLNVVQGTEADDPNAPSDPATYP